MPLNWDDIQYFLAVARHGSTLAAARAMKKSQSTVHRRLGELEASLGQPLVKRHPTGYRLTPFGLALLPDAESMELAANALTQHLERIRNDADNVVRLTCPEPIMYLMTKAGLIDKFHELYPELRVEFVLSDKYVDLATGEADVALRSGDTEDSDLVGRKIADSLWAVFASRSFVALNGKPGSIDDIKRFPIVALDTSMAGHRLTQWLANVIPNAVVASRNASILGLVSSVKAGLGVAALPMSLGAKEPELVLVLGPIPELTRPWRILAHPDMRTTPRVAAFFDFIAAESEALRPILSG